MGYLNGLFEWAIRMGYFNGLFQWTISMGYFNGLFDIVSIWFNIFFQPFLAIPFQMVTVQVLYQH